MISPSSGALPRELDGTYVRNGPNPQFAPAGQYHWFDGDGMLHAVRFDGGRASYRNRWVRTRGFELERKRGRALWTGLLERRQFDNPEGAVKNTANAGLVCHAGRLLALHDQGEPYEVELPGLDTAGVFTANRRLRHPLAPHPKVDPATGEMFAIGYSPVAKPHLQYSLFAADGGARAHHRDRAPDRRHGPRLRADRALRGADEPPVHVRRAPLAARRADRALRAGARLVHRPPAAARVGQRGALVPGRAVLRLPRGERLGRRRAGRARRVPPLGARPGRRPRAAARARGALAALALAHRPARQRDGARGSARREPRRPALDPPGEGRAARPLRVRVAAALRRAPAARRRAPEVRPREAGGPGGPLRSARTGSGARGSSSRGPARADEDDGWLLAFVHDEAEGQSELLVVDARELAAPPLARVQLPQRVPFGSHGLFSPSVRG